MMKLFKTLLFLLILLISGQLSIFGQNNDNKNEFERDNILAPIVTLFDSMRAQDTTLLRSTFIENPYLATISGPVENLSYRDASTLDDFVNSIGNHSGSQLDERINTENIIIQSDGMMATAWVPYQFYVGDTFSHCGVNVFIMMKDEAGNWKTTSITDTRRKESCEI
jgi:hypothetical protein